MRARENFTAEAQRRKGRRELSAYQTVPALSRGRCAFAVNSVHRLRLEPTCDRAASRRSRPGPPLRRPRLLLRVLALIHPVAVRGRGHRGPAPRPVTFPAAHRTRPPDNHLREVHETMMRGQAIAAALLLGGDSKCGPYLAEASPACNCSA